MDRKGKENKMTDRKWVLYMFSLRSVGVTCMRPVDGLYTTVIATCKRLPGELGVVVYQVARSSDAFSGFDASTF